MKEIVYLNYAEAIPPKKENGKWKIEELNVTKPPTKCRVTINGKIIIDDVYVYCKEGQNICLYNNYTIEKRGFCCEDLENCWAMFMGRGLVLEFKSENFVIESI